MCAQQAGNSDGTPAALATRMKTLSLLATLLLTTAPAVAGKPNCGDSFDLAPRHASVPRPAEDLAPTTPPRAHTLTDAQVGKVVQDRLTDIGHCWTKLPPKQRVEATAVLRLSVAPKGDVLDVMLGGDVPTGARQCMIAAVGRWV